MKSRVTVLLAAACMIYASLFGLAAQEYTQVPVKVSTEKVRNSDGKLYYSHVVQERQTLFSIAKAYGVTSDEICDANPTLNIKAEGLRKNSIILIPIIGQPREDAQEKGPEMVVQQSPEDIVHTVKWYEDIDDIAARYKVSAEAILKYNGLSSRKVKSRMKLRIPSGQDAQAQPEAPETAKPEVREQVKSTVGVSELQGTAEPAYTSEKGGFDWSSLFAGRKTTVNTVLILPFNAKGQVHENSMDFYGGFLMAVRELGKEGIGVDLSVYDAPGGSLPVTAERLNSSDLIIGPIAPPEIQKVLALASSRVPVISPLDPKTLSIVAEHPNLIHAPTPSSTQYEDMTAWVKADRRAQDKVIVISEKDAKNPSITNTVTELLSKESVPYSSFSYRILEGRGVENSLGALMTEEGTNRVIISSDSEAFVYDAVRNLNLLLHRKYDVILYHTARIRSFDTIDVEILHNLNMHLSLSYFIDYDNPRVKDFVLAYRALYNAEPSQFAFQGYDIASYFIASCHRHGQDWVRRLSSRPEESMLQTDFYFAEEGDGGFVNQGIRRVIYEKGFKVVNVGSSWNGRLQ